MPTTPSDQGKAASEFEASLAQAQQATQQANQTKIAGTQSTPPAEAKAEQAAKVKVGEEEFSPDQLAELVKKGKTAKEWEDEKPGFDLDSLYADYTRKSQELAQFKERQEKEEPNEVQLSPEQQILLKKAVDPLIENRLQKERDTQALELFKKNHPEYVEVAAFNKFSKFFNNYYKLPTDVTAQLAVMEMAHQNMNFENAVEKKALQEKGKTLAEMQKLEMASIGGGSQKTTPTSSDQYTTEQLYYLKDWGLVK